MKTPDFSEWVQRFFQGYLSRQRNVSPATVAAYRDTFRLLLQYWRQRRRQDLATLFLESLTADTVLGFLTHLEESRFRTFATREVADELLKSGFSLGGKYVNVSVMFADIRSYTSYSETEDPAEIIEPLNNYFALMFDAITANNGTVNQMQGDGLMAIFGAPAHYGNHREQAVSAALEMIELLRAFNEQRVMQNKSEVRIGIGIATGKVIAGYTGTQHQRHVHMRR